MTKRRITFSVAASVCIAMLCVAPVAHAQSAATAGTERARALIVDRQFERALAELDDAIAEDAELAVAHYLRGVALGNLRRPAEAYDAFVRAADLTPGWGEAHQMATVAAIDAGDMQAAWEQAVKAHQSGIDMGDSIQRLLTLFKAPEDVDQQLAAARVFVMPLNTEKLAAREDNPFGVDVIGGGGGGGTPDPWNTSASRATNVGGQQISESQSDFYQLLQQTRRSLAQSRHFGVVPRQEMAQFLLVIEVDELGGATKSLEGYIKLFDPRSGEEVYRRLLQLRNISSRADLNADIERYIDYMEEWLLDRSG